MKGRNVVQTVQYSSKPSQSTVAAMVTTVQSKKPPSSVNKSRYTTGKNVSSTSQSNEEQIYEVVDDI